VTGVQTCALPILVLSKVQVDHQSAVLRFRTRDQRYVSISVAHSLGRGVRDLLPDRLPSRRIGPDATAGGVHRPLESGTPTCQPEDALFAPAKARKLAMEEGRKRAAQIRVPPAPARSPPHPTLRTRPRGSGLARLTWVERLERHAERGVHATLGYLAGQNRQGP